MRRSLAGPGNSKYEHKITPAIDPGLLHTGSYIKKQETDIMNNPLGKNPVQTNPTNPTNSANPTNPTNSLDSVKK